MSSYFKYVTITAPLIKAVKQATGCICIEHNSSGEQPAYPFATYSITSPEITNQHDKEGSQFEVALSLTFHDSSSINVLNIAKMCESFFDSQKGRAIFAERDVVLAYTENFERRDNFISIDYERLAGFDVRLRVAETFVDDIDTIENIKIGGN